MALRVAIGSDHAAFDVKQEIVQFLESAEMRPFVSVVTDVGPSNADRVDYPDYAAKCAAEINEGRSDCGVLLCGTGIGISIAANKVKGIRAALCHDHFTAKMCREHNDANIMCAGARTTGIEVIKEMVAVYLATPFGGGRHADRVAKISALEADSKAE